MRTALRQHWPEYLIEALGLGVFMVSAGLFARNLYLGQKIPLAGVAHQNGTLRVLDHLLEQLR